MANKVGQNGLYPTWQWLHSGLCDRYLSTDIAVVFVSRQPAADIKVVYVLGD